MFWNPVTQYCYWNLKYKVEGEAQLNLFSNNNAGLLRRNLMYPIKELRPTTDK